MSDSSTDDDRAEVAPTPGAAAPRLPWEEPTLHRLSLSRSEMNLGVGTDGNVESNLS
jgi:hypothetical protein